MQTQANRRAGSSDASAVDRQVNQTTRRASSDASEFHLQWHQHRNTLVSVFDSLWERQELVDITLAVRGHSLHVHKVVLCACSQYFQEILESGPFDKPSVIFLKDVDSADLQTLVHYMYKGEVRVGEDRLDSFLQTAKSLGIRGIADADESNARQVKQEAEPEKPTNREENSQIPPKRSTNRSRRKRTRKSSRQDDYTSDSTPEDSDYDLLATEMPARSAATGLLPNEPDFAGILEEENKNPMETFESHDFLDTSHFETGHESYTDDNQRGTRGDRSRTNSRDNEMIGNQTASADNMEGHYSNEDMIPDYQIPHDKNQFYCPRCGRGYMYKHTVRRHLRYECGVEPQFICPVCEAKFHHKVVLSRHMKKHGK